MRLRTRNEIEELMRRLGMAVRIPEAKRIHPDVVDLDRDERLLSDLGLNLDEIVNGLGGSAW